MNGTPTQTTRKARSVAAGRPAQTAGDTVDPRRLSADLLSWYAISGRDLPWRRSRDPYRVWVSEIMLQQTQVDRVRPFFTRFIARFPSVHTLAAAAEEDVLRLWEGLGYYRRARQLHAAARRIVRDHGGQFPHDVAGLRSLPGIGRYTAAAIASIALDLPEPIVEANSRRVIARLIAHAHPLDGPRGDEPIWQAAAAILPPRETGRFNQALMDLGALICLPDRPLCTRCPVATHCAAHLAGLTASIPMKSRQTAVRRVRETAAVVRRGGRVLVVQRGPGEWWQGLWDFPRVLGPGRRVAQLVTRDATLLPLGCQDFSRIGTFRHSVTCHQITLDVVACAATRPGPRARGRRWVTLAALARLAMSAPARKIARLLARR